MKCWGRKLTVEWPLIQGGVVILLVTSCYGTGTGFHWMSHWAQVQTVYLFSKDCVIIIVTNIYKQLVKSTIMMIK